MIDLGTNTVKAGYAGEESPKVYFPSVSPCFFSRVFFPTATTTTTFFPLFFLSLPTSSLLFGVTEAISLSLSLSLSLSF